MALQVVVDASLVVASALLETFTPQAKAILTYWNTQQIEMIAPKLFQYEVISITRKAVYQRRIQQDEAVPIIDYFLHLPITYILDDSLLRRAYELATLYNRPTAYDSQYLAVAERHQCEFWTADERLYNAIHPAWGQVRWLGNWTAA
jgi:predicted nucleic acid-binding protein